MTPDLKLAALISGAVTPTSENREFSPFLQSLPLRWGGRDVGSDRARHSSGCGEALSLRERDILAMISQGLTNKHVARALDISPETVKSHVKHIFMKLTVSTRAEAVCRAGSLGLLPREESTPVAE